MSNKEKVLAKWPDAHEHMGSSAQHYAILTKTARLSDWHRGRKEAWADAARRLK